MYNGTGLQTARGSGTSGHVQTNRFSVTSNPKTSSTGFGSGQGTAGLTRGVPNQEILEHDRKRMIELKLLELEEKLIDQGYTDTEIVEKLDEAKALLVAAQDDNVDDNGTIEKLSETQTHQIAARKEKQMETLKAALGIESDKEKSDRL